jgi:REP element-mobilizing transposase RayT
VALVQARLWEYMGGLLRARQCIPLAIGGTDDHVHILCQLGREISLAALVREVKAVSSRWVHETFPEVQGFGWQAGYGAFTIGVERVALTVDYIRGQEEHHRTRSFEDEFRSFLEKHAIEVDERYLWD